MVLALSLMSGAGNLPAFIQTRMVSLLTLPSLLRNSARQMIESSAVSAMMALLAGASVGRWGEIGHWAAVGP